MKKNILFLLLFISPFGFSQSSSELVKNYLETNSGALKTSSNDLSDWIIKSEANSAATGITSVYVTQRYSGIEIVGAVTNFSVKNQKIINVGNRFEADLLHRVNTVMPKIKLPDALSKVYKSLGTENKSNPVPQKTGPFTYKIPNGLLHEDPIRAQLVLYPVNETEIRLAWDFCFYSQDYNHLWSVKIDAENGQLLDKKDLVLRCHFETGSPATTASNSYSFTSGMLKNPTLLESSGYRVFPYFIESPDHGARELISAPYNTTASPFGWHDTNGIDGPEFTVTRGNNAWAKEDLAGNDEGGTSPDGGSGLLFDFPYPGTNVPATQYTDAATTNLFYMCNIMHDILYQYGFTEANGNFQQNNYGKGGDGDDAVIADSQDGSGSNNANFTSPPDGFQPRMQMFLWNRQPPKKIITINAPAELLGEYQANDNNFIPGHADLPVSPNGITSDLVLYNADDGCTAAVNASQLNGKIAVVKRGQCNFVVKVKNAQVAGAIAVIVINNADGAFIMSGDDAEITIPAISITKALGDQLLDKMASATVNVTLSMPVTGFVNSDSDLANGVIAHEYAHGISSRLTGGPANSFCLESTEQMGEGWSDFYALMLQMKGTDNGSERKGFATFLSQEPVDGQGIRLFPYSTDMTIDPLTYGDTNGMTFQDDGQTKINVHSVGTVWASVLWDLAWKYVEKYGYDPNIYTGTGGNNKVLQLITDALKLQPCNPSFISGRDAILFADKETTGGVDNCLIWEVFARRGLGLNASCGLNSGVAAINDQVEDFTMPPTDDNCTSYLNKDTIMVFPNPVDDLVNITVYGYSGDLDIRIFDMNGRSVYREIVKNFKITRTIDLDRLQRGIYVLKLTGNDLNYTKKLILD
ncbi:T9SS-dependent M36 family metallopeptidase [Flavobacterium humi]|uniref:T9SS type A sorting domain-containing protein n=1 Tax=Flavobacterium humi TaxID=2562683 RepID=A0A4Z0L6R1_9FLAO|nr:T9SS-dependent M36 family metallopeptidase [Flavobacterium humi]TGD57687.1 T9SS type A sorting domain-containing protein [Flavobacterium humi]